MALSTYYWLQLTSTILFCACAVHSFPDQRWRLDRNYEPWTMEGSFILGTPRECPPVIQPENGRWVCSFGDSENERSLCMVDCMKGYIIKQHPQIYNCERGRWSTFPEPKFGNDLIPFGDCIVNPRYPYDVDHNK